MNPEENTSVVKPFDKKKTFLGLLVLIIALGLGFVVTTVIQMKRMQSSVTEVVQTEDQNSIDVEVPGISEPVVERELKVTWSDPKPTPSPDIFKGGYSENYGNYDFRANSKSYIVGTVSGGEYNGTKVLHVNIQTGGMEYYIVKVIDVANGKKVIVSGNGEINTELLNESKVVVDKGLVIKDLFYPTSIKYGGDTLVGGYDDGKLFSDEYKPQDLKLAFVDPIVGNIFMDIIPKSVSTNADGSHKEGTRNGFYVKAPDGTIRKYSLRPYFYESSDGAPVINWNDGTKNSTDYTYTEVGGCGSTNFAAIVPGITLNDLVAVGTAGSSMRGDKVYELKNTNHQLLLDQYMVYYPQYGEQKMPYEQFVKSHPLFFWVDPFGRIIKFASSQFMSGAECGKPVIYLYPEEATKVSVKLNPVGGFTKSEPAYDGGWEVIATPEGKLTETKSNKVFPYLFWEGRGGLYETPKKGFVVKNADVHIFLVEKLAKLGLNEKESADFREFWEPRMKDAPYYFVTFMGNQTMNQIAPLNITPKPDTVIRVLMDFLPLEKSIAVEEFNIRTPERKGFTVVEWGGVIR